jgi:alpha-beta hydrolase superfamily lysophospholipase
MRASSAIVTALVAAPLVAGCDDGGRAGTGASTTGAANPSTASLRATPAPTLLRAADGVAISAAHGVAAEPRALILLFHQAGSGKGEYATIAPRLNAAGYETLAVDQRSGGDMFGRNETVARLGRPASYAEAERDLEAAFAWARTRRLPIMVWGSSYSAALVFRVAARHPGEVKAVLAFSPGEYLDAPDAVRKAAARVAAPIYVTSASARAEVDAARAILAASPAKTKTQFVPGVGIHGSSTLVSARDPEGAAENWRAVLSFLGSLS